MIREPVARSAQRAGNSFLPQCLDGQFWPRPCENSGSRNRTGMSVGSLATSCVQLAAEDTDRTATSNVADPENGRILWLDLQGTFLDERKYGGQFYNVTFDADGQLWASVHPKAVSLNEESYVVKLDTLHGRISVRSKAARPTPLQTLATFRELMAPSDPGLSYNV